MVAGRIIQAGGPWAVNQDDYNFKILHYRLDKDILDATIFSACKSDVDRSCEFWYRKFVRRRCDDNIKVDIREINISKWFRTVSSADL
jgi:hypothetical protein